MTTGTYEYQSSFARRYFAQGVTEGTAQGEARALLAFLAARGIEVPAAARARIAALHRPRPARGVGTTCRHRQLGR